MGSHHQKVPKYVAKDSQRSIRVEVGSKQRGCLFRDQLVLSATVGISTIRETTSLSHRPARPWLCYDCSSQELTEGWVVFEFQSYQHVAPQNLVTRHRLEGWLCG